jgi:hypothetical protein
MTIDELRAERKKTEDAIYALLDTFKAKTGVCPIGVNVQVISTERTDGDRDRFLGRVSINLESL